MSEKLNVTIFCWSRAVHPITHADRSEGNVAVLAREPVLVESSGDIRFVPYLSGNALRHKCVREPGSSWLVDRLGLHGHLTLPQVNFLFHGGSITESTGHERLARLATLRDVIPVISALGGCLPDQIISGSLQVSRGVLVCRENRSRIESMLPDGFSLDGVVLRPAEDFVRPYQYTRFDAVASASQVRSASVEGVMNAEAAIANGTVADRGQSKGKSSTMPFSGDSIIPGACFAHTFTLQRSTALEVGAVLHALSSWQERGGVVGSQAARGHGRLETSVRVSGVDDDVESLIARYEEHMATVSPRAIEWISEAFAPRAAKAKKAKPKMQA